jgi:hypothetical protein
MAFEVGKWATRLLFTGLGTEESFFVQRKTPGYAWRRSRCLRTGSLCRL